MYIDLKGSASFTVVEKYYIIYETARIKNKSIHNTRGNQKDYVFISHKNDVIMII